MEKIKITPEQESALKEFIHMTEKLYNEKPFDRFIKERGRWEHQYKSMNEFTPEQFTLLLIDHYEVEEDWEYARSKLSNVIYTKKELEIRHLDHNYLEKATKEEYNEHENRKLFWSSGRSYGEFKLGDSFAHASDFYFIVENSEDVTTAKAYFDDGHIKHIYFIEDRKEILN
jgi:hypothetical protein